MVPADNLTESDEPLTAVLAAAQIGQDLCLLSFRSDADRAHFISKVHQAIAIEGLAYIDVL